MPGSIKVKCKTLPQHAKPVYHEGRPCYEVARSHCQWEAEFLLEAGPIEAAFAVKQSAPNGPRTPWVHQQLARWSVGIDTNGRPCQYFTARRDEYFALNARGKAVRIDYHSSGTQWALKCPRICEWTSYTIMHGELVWIDGVNGKPFEGVDSYTDQGDTITEYGRTGNADGTRMGEWHSRTTPEPADSKLPNTEVDSSFGRYFAAYAAQVVHCKDKSGNIIGGSLPPGSPAGITNEERYWLITLYLGAFPYGAPDVRKGPQFWSGRKGERWGPMELVSGVDSLRRSGAEAASRIPPFASVLTTFLDSRTSLVGGSHTPEKHAIVPSEISHHLEGGAFPFGFPAVRSPFADAEADS